MADELQAEQTPGFKVGEKKTLDEYNKLGKFKFPDFSVCDWDHDKIHCARSRRQEKEKMRKRLRKS